MWFGDCGYITGRQSEFYKSIWSFDVPLHQWWRTMQGSGQWQSVVIYHFVALSLLYINTTVRSWNCDTQSVILPLTSKFPIGNQRRKHTQLKHGWRDPNRTKTTTVWTLGYELSVLTQLTNLNHDIWRMTSISQTSKKAPQSRTSDESPFCWA